MGQRRSAPLLEREAELAALDGLLDRARRRIGGLAVVEGPAGIGKSSLLAEVARASEAKGIGVLAARGSPLERELSPGVALQLLAPVVSVGEGEEESLFSGAAALARPLFDPAAGPEAAPPELDPSFALLHGLHWLVANLAERRPLLLAVDDAHWADGASLRFLHYLAQRLEGLPVAIIVCLRSGEAAGGAEAGALDELRAHPDALALAPAPLSGSAVVRLVSAELPDSEDAFGRACAEVTAGNPLYLHELLTAVSADRVPPTRAGVASLPRLSAAAVGRGVLTRLGRLPEHQRALARAAAIAGDGAPLRHAAGVAGLDTGPAGEAGDLLVAADVLDRAEPLAFAHPIVREAIYAELPGGERGRGHLEVARLLESESAIPEEVAIHLLEAERGSEGWVVDSLCAAAERARARGAPGAARRYLDRALEEGGGLGRRGEVLFRLGLAEATAGEGRGGARIAEAAAEIDDPEQRALALMNLARILGVQGRFKQSAEVFAEAVDALDGVKSELRWWADAGYAMSGSHHPPSRRRAVARLEELLERPGLEQLPIGRGLLGFGAIERIYAGRPAAEAIELARRVAGEELAEVEQDGVPFRIAAMALALCGELGEAERLADLVSGAARDQGSAVEEAAVSYVRMLIEHQRGRVPQLTQEALAAIDGLRLGWGIGVPSARAALAIGHLERGELAEAAGALELEREERWADDFQYPFWIEARGGLLLAEAKAEEALVEFERSGRLQEERGLRAPALSHLPWRSGAALAAGRLGDRERAMRLAAEEHELAERCGLPRPLGTALRTRGLVAGGAEGIELLAVAVEVHQRSASSLELARSLTELGAALRRAKQRRECREPLRRGLDLARRCGALALADRAETELRASGARPRRLVLAGVESLTPSERRVAALAAAGHTNRQVAEQLFLTKKTVETHLGSVYRKLEIGSRKELPAALAGGDPP